MVGPSLGFDGSPRLSESDAFDRLAAAYSDTRAPSPVRAGDGVTLLGQELRDG